MLLALEETTQEPDSLPYSSESSSSGYVTQRTHDHHLKAEARVRKPMWNQFFPLLVLSFCPSELRASSSDVEPVSDSGMHISLQAHFIIRRMVKAAKLTPSWLSMGRLC